MTVSQNFTSKFDPDMTTFTPTTPEITTQEHSDDDDASYDVIVEVVSVATDEVELMVTTPEGSATSFQVALFQGVAQQPHVKMVARLGTVTLVTLGPLASGTNFTVSIKVGFADGGFVEEKVSFDTKPEDFEIIRVDDETACVRIRNKKNVKEAFTVSMDRASLNSNEGFSDDF